MASKEEMERLIRKVIADKSFKDQFLKNPKASASKIGIEPYSSTGRGLQEKGVRQDNRGTREGSI